MFDRLRKRWSGLGWVSRHDDATRPPEDGPVESLSRYKQLRESGLALLVAGRAEEALESLAAAAALAHRLPEAHLNLSRAFTATGRWEAARQALDWAKSLNDKYERDAELHNQIAEQSRTLPKPPPARENFEPDQTLHSSLTGNRWTVLQKPSLGGFGAVYKVRDHDDAKVYALKTFKATLVWSEEDRQRFTREAAIWMRLPPHPNIVRAEWIETIEDFPCVVQEFVEGGDLAHLLKTQSLQLGRALELALHFCDAMAFANDTLRLVHRDVKPSNCLLTSGGVLKVGDFGLAHILAESRGANLGLGALQEHPGLKRNYTMPFGTESYMAPEQDDATAALDTRTDIYGFGVMLFEMLTRRAPRYGRFAHRDFLRLVPEYKLPRALWKLILRCVEPDPLSRPQTFHEVRSQLETILRRTLHREPPRAASPTPVDSSYWQNKAVAFQVLEMYEDAIGCCRRALELDPRDADVLQNHGAILHRAGRDSEALLSLKKALALNADDPDIFNNLALVCRALGDRDGALAYIEDARRNSPADVRILKNQADFLYEAGRFAEALEITGVGLGLAPREVPLQELRSFILVALRDGAAALAVLQEALAVAPRRFGLWKCKALAHELVGEWKDADQACAKALEIQPNDDQVLRIWSRVRGAAPTEFA